MAKSTHPLLLRLAPWLLPVGTVIVWQLASSVGWLSTRVLPSPEGVLKRSGPSRPAVSCGSIWPSAHGGRWSASPSAARSG